VTKETEAQKQHRITNTERDHSKNPPPPVLVQAIPAHVPTDEPIDAPWHTQLAFPSKWFTPSAKSNRVVVVHCTAAENPASSTAAFFASSTDSGSTQGVVDSQEGFRCVPDNAVCAGAPPMNTTGLHCEQSGVETRTRAQWLSHIDEIDRLAYQTAQWCKTFGIPVKLLHTADLPANPADAHGITYHQAVSDRYHQSTHQDPGPGYPWDVFMLAVHTYFIGGGSDDMSDFVTGWDARRADTSPKPTIPTGKTHEWQAGWRAQDRLLHLEAGGNTAHEHDLPATTGGVTKP
jgi:hypothetical protein